MSPHRRAARLTTLAVVGVVGVASALAIVPAHAVGEVADVAISQAAIGTARVGTASLLVVTVVNNGPDAVVEAIVPGGVPVGSTLNTVTPSQGACAKGRNSVYTCNFGAMAAGTSARATVSFTPTTPGPATAQASVSGSGAADPDTTNNVSRLVVDVASGPVDLQLNASASTKSPAAGAVFDERFQVKVSGKDGAVGVALDVQLPADGALVGAVTSTGAACAVDGTALRCPLGALAGGGQASVTVTLQAPPVVDAVLVTTAVVSHAGVDPRPANDTATLEATTR